MNSRWVDIPGITVVNEQARLPCDPNVVLLTFSDVIEKGSEGRSATKAQIVKSVSSSTHADKRRIRGLVDWLEETRVVRWTGAKEQLELFPGTDVIDLAYRFIAWVASQPVRTRFSEVAQRFLHGLRTQAAMDFRAQQPRSFSPTAVQAWFADAGRTETRATMDPVDGPLRRKLDGLLRAFDDSFVERQRVVRAVFLTVLSGQHALLLGPPGTAKSMLARAICSCFEDATYFEYLLSRFTHPDELFGPVSIPGLKKEDYRRLTEGFLPAAHIGFLDEIFKANSAILNALLTLVNERVFHHGRHRDDVPLLAVIGASNELPETESGLGALYDRFLVRMVVPPLAGADGFLKVALGDLPAFAPKKKDRLTLDDLQAIQVASAQIEVPQTVATVLAEIWRSATERDWGVSDRRWRQAIAMLKVAAATDGRQQVALTDLLLLEPVLAPDPSHLAAARDLLLEQIRPEAAPTHDLMSQWLLINSDRVAPVSGLPYLEGTSADTMSLEDRLVLRQHSLARYLALHDQAVQTQAEHRGTVERFGERHLWIERTPVALLEPHIEASRHLARLLRTAEKYRDGIASRKSVALRLLSQLPVETKAGPQQFDALAEVEGVGAFGLFNGGWRRVQLSEGIPRWVMSESEFFDWLSGEAETEELLKGAQGWTGASRLRPLEKIRRAWADLVIPSPGAPPKP